MDARPAYEGTLDESRLFAKLPNEIAELIHTASGTQYLNALAVGALRPGCTEGFFCLYEPIFVDLAARWLLSDSQLDQIDILSAFSRVLPFAPNLRPFASQYAIARAGPLSALAACDEQTLSQINDATIRSLLLAIFRLLSYDPEVFSKAVSPSQLQSLFQHRDRSVRYLSIRCFALYMRAADAALEELIKTHFADDIVEGEWEGTTIDHRCLGLWEERRWNTLEKQVQLARSNRSTPDTLSQIEKLREYFTSRTAEICGVLVPRQNNTPSQPSSIVKTPTAVGNLRKIATALISARPMLLVGLPNSGKTTLINDVAATMGQAETMVTLHLNEQTDAKSLLGMYSTSPATGSFAWQPGVLTKAAREGRWILIEDLDRAPSEVIGLILPIIERGELTIASRKERIKCAEGFKIIATMKSSYNIAGEEIAPSTNILGSRLWQRVQIDSLAIDEIREVITQKYSLLESRVATIMDVYQRLCASFHGSLAIKSSQGRTPGLRDLIKLCSRMHRRLQRLGAKTGYEATPEGAEDEIFLDVVDVFLKYIPEKTLADSLSLVVAEALQISPQRARFCMHERTPTYSDQGNSLTLGRETCRKIKQVAASVQMAEPVLLVGETGIGKTTVIQQLATLMRQKLTVVNLSQQSESTDLLGGFKPVNIRTMAVPMHDEFVSLFELTFSAKKNQKFLHSVAKSVTAGNWARLVHLWHEAVRLADGVFKSDQGSQGAEEQPAKKRKLDSPKYQLLRQRWDRFAAQLNDFESQVSQGDAKFAFAFVQGKIVRALRNGEWVLLDEVNLASPDTLENIASLLHHGSEGSPSVLLSEAGDVERVFGHPDFRIFGAMNPATDAGKKDLPPGLRSRFTEFYVQSPDSDLDDLLSLIQKYLGDLALTDARAVPDLGQLYMEAKKLNTENKLTDGAGQRPHFSIRTLVRALVYVADHAHIYGLRRAIYEGFSMSFLTVLSQESERLLAPLLEKHIFSNVKNSRALLGQTPKPPNDGNDYVQFKHYWMRRGHLQPEEQPHYIITPFIEKNLKNLVRASSTRRFPVLLQGPTSAGKTSMIEFLAKVSGNQFVRINNHEHTDLQEYLGTYVSSDDGTLRYQEGVLVEALRNGYWIVLDELNLAPSDVLEALNRLLDDNRELFIPETQEVVRPHPNFMLFATQNPAGLYGGRKVLSRAFRNRFLELHFDDIPESELEYILKERSQIAPSFCTRIVSVYRKLSLLRQANRLFEQKNSFATLRDLFRWALRRADDRDQLAINGFMLLAERVRNPQERAAVKSVIEEVMRVRIDEDVIYGASEMEKRAPNLAQLAPGIVWTKAMRRLFVLVSTALENNEPILLVGETGCGKTQLCQAVAEICRKQLYIINAHVNLETGDLIGAQRPVRNRASIESQLLSDLRTIFSQDDQSASVDDLKQAFGALSAEQLQALDPELRLRVEKNLARLNALFEWSDGSLITAMKTGQFFLLDEISLADDSVLERLNSVLEPHRSILLAEKGPIDSMVVAHEGFQFLSTMNPGGDYGKRELSAALRNRMTEIWAPQLSEDEDILPILRMKLQLDSVHLPKAMLQFAKWFKTTFQNSTTSSLSIRDLLGWVEFVNRCQSSDPMFAVVQGAAMVFVDTLGANPAAILATALNDLEGNRRLCLDKLQELFDVDASNIYLQKSTIDTDSTSLRVGPFNLPINAQGRPDPEFIMDAPTTIGNSVRIARGLQLPKPILLEGSPGVGKTTLVTALAKALGKPLTRINLSEQTDLTDLFGSDVPVEGGDVGQFAWRDAPFLQAMQRGDWVLLDEMNLASQSVLEGLNACLDHRQMVYVAELDQTFKRHPDFVLFAAQNPHHQGGGRKGLPASFVNRFTVVYADSFTDTDLRRICAKLFPGSPATQTDKLVEFVSLLNKAIQERRLGALGGPWEVNLRDIQRWLQLADRGNLQVPAVHFLDIIISQRFRSEEDRSVVSQLFGKVFGDSLTAPKSYYHNLTPGYMQVGLGFMRRDSVLQQTSDPQMQILPGDLSVLESLMLCVEQSWPSILVGSSGCGKTTLIRKLAALNGASLVELALSADTDTMDLVGGFEQIDYKREVSSLLLEISQYLQRQIISAYASRDTADLSSIPLQLYETLQSPDVSLDNVVASLVKLYESYPQPLLQDYANRAQRLSGISDKMDKMKVGFEWTEGVLTQAVQNGQWVVLDNANLCNPSVLDRLNSLTEPNGTLILNEQRTEDGNARIIKPHPDFRLFLTMDPRHGELSRAMRNRCVEISFLPQEDLNFAISSVPAYTCQSSLYRLRSLWNLDVTTALEGDESVSLLHEACLDHLSIADVSYLQRVQGLLPFYSSVNADDPLLAALQRYLSVIHDNSSCRPFDCIKADFAVGFASVATQGIYQPLHPLVNEPLASIMHQSVPLGWLMVLAQLQESKLGLQGLRQGLLRANESGKHLKPSQMNSLERSLASGRIPSLMKDATQPVGAFLSDCGQAVYDFIQSLDQSVFQVSEVVPALRAMINFCSDIYNLTTASEVDQGEFQIYLQLGRELSASLLDGWAPLKPLGLAFSQALDRFHENWALTTGLSMQRLWESWRPATSATQDQLSALLELENIALEFTQIATKTHLDLSQLSQVRKSLIAAQEAILSSGHEGYPVQDLRQTVVDLAACVPDADALQKPYFSTEFEVLCQYHDLSSLRNGQTVEDQVVQSILPLLAGRPARPLDASSLKTQIPVILNRLSLYAGSEPSSAFGAAVSGTLSLSLLERLAYVGTTSLGQMNALEMEKKTLSKALTLTSGELAINQAMFLRQAMARLTTELVMLHKDFFEPKSLEQILSILRGVESQGSHKGFSLPSINLASNLPDNHFFKSFAQSQLPRLLSSLMTEQMDSTGAGIVQLAVILLQLFVPDKPFDPSLGLVVQRKRHAQRSMELTARGKAISSFEVGFSGQSSNLRQEIMQGELRNLGAAPPPSSVTRPQTSELNILHGEFSSLVRSVLERHPEYIKFAGDDSDAESQRMVGLLRENIRQLSRRLTTNYRSYDDITTLVVRFLQLLDLGLFLSSSKSRQSSDAQIIKAIRETTPFLGGLVHPMSGSIHKESHFESSLNTDLWFHELSALRVAENADKGLISTRNGRDTLRRLFEQFHALWKVKLREDQEEEARKNELYHYKGSWEDAEEVDENELRQLFPTYDENADEEGKVSSRVDPKAISVRLASLHAKLFNSENQAEVLSAYVKQSSLLLGSLRSDNGSLTIDGQPKEQLSGVLLLLEDALKSGEVISGKNYNFYVDSNMVEAKKLVDLTLSTKARFAQIQKSWPDHAVLADVIQCCREILQFKHTEPVAKFLTKVEKLHSLVYEWQLVASREYSAASLYDEITGTIIGWRRLELTTWAKLLDLENDKCLKDVSSWWFITYEALVRAPIQIAESGEMELKDHIQEVTATLEQFFRSTTVGQYSERLRLIKNFQSLLLLYVEDLPSLSQLTSALDNFLQRYRQFEPPVLKLLAEKRQALEKNIKEQIQLASWKDTNIVALRESARRSHVKLFKLVRKYREALAQPAQPILEHDMPEDNEDTAAPQRLVLPSFVFPEALAMCQTEEKAWIDRPPRFKNPDNTASSMMQVYGSISKEFDVAEDLESFVKYVVESIKEFKSQTPKTLTEENKDDVQHLKVQKRRFYADTLHRIYEMGVKRNVNTSLLEAQASVPQVLATIPAFEAGIADAQLLKKADSYFHRFLDLLPRVRLAARDYSEDLSNVEISRSSGSVEHLLHLVRKQRTSISPALSNLKSLDSLLSKVANLWTADPLSIFKAHSGFSNGRDDITRAVAWLAPIIGLAITVVGLHAKFSGINSTGVIESLQAWKDTFDRLKTTLSHLPELPEGMASRVHKNTVEEACTAFTRLNFDLATWTEERPDLSFVLGQIIPWSTVNAVAYESESHDLGVSIEEYDSSLIAAADKILVSIQKLNEAPSQITAPGALSRSDDFFVRALRLLRMEDISTSLKSVLDKLQHLQTRSPSSLPFAIALTATLLPILNKFAHICRDVVDRYLTVHKETCKMSYILAKSFTQIASEGFCSPSEPSTEESKSGQLESGTGLGEGEGAEDISKDVADDEDLTELAQEDKQKTDEEIENSEDAVNMDQEEMQGEEGERKEGDDEDDNESGSDEEDDIDEEVGDVDDLDASAVDEKMWDGEHDDQQKETETQEGKGAAENDEQTAAPDQQPGQEAEKGENKEGEEEEEEEDDEEGEEAPDEEGEAVGREDMDVTDPHAKEEEALDLPEEMQLDGDEKGNEEPEEDDGLDDDMMDNDLPPAEEEQQTEGDGVEDETMEQDGEEQEIDQTEEAGPDDELGDADEAEGNDEANEAGEEAEEEEKQEDDFLAQRDENEAAGEEVAPSEAVNGGLGAEQDQNQEKGSSGNAQQESGSTDPSDEKEQKTGAAQEGDENQRHKDEGGANDSNPEDPQLQAFKKLGDVLEQWHRRQKEIMDASKQEDDEAETRLPEDTDMADADFEHLADQDDVADTQALGQANEEQAKALDQNKGVESDVKPDENNELLPDITDDNIQDLPEHRLEDEMQLDQGSAPTESQTAGAFIPGNLQSQERADATAGQEAADEELDEVDAHLAAIHLSSTLPPLTPRDEAQRLWSYYESATTDLSLSLTEQLRLILAPTLATKLRGDFRTGKRLNIKRIIPYIASQYKRDKIWMRRSIPSKRNYQIMLAVDDSKSMLESGSGQLAFETLALVAKSLSMLEAGDLCVLGFGSEDHVRVAHEFGKPFSSEAGTQVFQHFSYQQTGTNVRKLIADSIALFREARWKQSPGGGNADLWQLELIISDGICEDHETISRLVRQAQEERIMIVFIIVDAVKGSSILDLTQASFEPDLDSGSGEMKLKMKRYLEGFPFPYYLVVRDVRELPAVLATALKQWFAEVVDVSS
ncbi:AAA family ATPase midasin [Aspergillus aculeatinus CBS 121060]|uniref:Midasin n=1 Tax=Aspergillus aculeatinus CBS 121060 TaxID=1448322 RepID=A0ACD1GZ78_9EURO|nr:midasin [Aspergillus aculeatinus CBS 121060]RAH66637.1 midasin [Aspergillus aculeatinus CBS 121060]